MKKQNGMFYRLIGCYLPWVVIVIYGVLVLPTLKLRNGNTIAPEISELGTIFSNALFYKRFSLGDVNVWSDMTGNMALMERKNNLVGVLTTGGKNQYLEVFKEKNPALLITFSDKSEALVLKVCGVGAANSFWMYDSDWSGTANRRIKLKNASVSNSTVEEYVGGEWRVAKPNKGEEKQMRN